jgi:helicase
MKIPKAVQKELDKLNIKELRPSQKKSIEKGLFDKNNLLVCTPTASGKTLVGEMAIINSLSGSSEQSTSVGSPICIYVVPLRALASEKYKDFQKKYTKYKIALTSGDMDNNDRYLETYDIIITTSEKLDSLMRHHSQWLNRVTLVIIDEIHLLNDSNRGPTLEILITALRNKEPKIQLIGLSATIGNAKELASWLNAELVEDKWRPVRLDKGIYFNGQIQFPNK